MFIYLSKKIAIPNQTKINSLAWNKEDGYIAVGGEEGLLKVFKLDASEYDTNKNKGLSVTSNLSLNQTLEGHNESIKVLVWNESQKKLTTSDNSGVIIVWMMYKGSWYEEMINNRKKSTVAGMSWSSDGLKICIIYEDGAVIVGSVDGNKIWGKELKSVALCCVQWSPDGKLLLFGLKTGEVQVYDNQGSFIKKLVIHCLDSPDEEVPIACIDWYSGKHGYINYFCPNLAISYENGRVQLMYNESGSSESSISLNTGMAIVHCSWNHNGSLIAITGKQMIEEKFANLVQFYNPFGEHLRTLKVPGMSISSCVWEGGSLRVALAVDSSIYFANIRPDYKWCCFKNTLVYTSCKMQKPGMYLTFWDIANDQVHNQHISALLAIAGCEDHCVISVPSDSAEETGGKYGLILCNTVGTPVDGKYVNIETIFVAMSSTFVAAASKDNFLIWQYKTPKSIGVEANKMKSLIFHIDDTPLGTTNIIQDLDDTELIQTTRTHTSFDPICCIACSNKCLLIGRESGTIQYYALPHIVLTKRYKVQARPHKIAINCSSTKMSVIDVGGVLSIIDISDGLGRPTVPTESNKFERKDVWSMCWASDNPQLLAIMEKTRMYIFKGNSPEEPIASSGYIYSFNDLEVQSVLLDEIMKSPEKPTKNSLIKVEVKSLRDTRILLEKVGLTETESFIEDNQHPRLWRLLGEAALKTMNLEMASNAFIRSKNYARVLFVKKLSEFNNTTINKGKIASYFKNFDEAEKIFMEADRSDLALDLRQMLGDWFRVIQILKNGATASDKVLEGAYEATAFFFKDSNNYAAAAEYFELAKNTKEVIECYYFLEDYDKLASYIEMLPEGDPSLKRIGDMFAMHAVHSEAVKAYIKFGDIKAAIDLCVLHNRWDTAIDLAKKYNILKISEYFTKYTEHLIEQNKVYQAIDVNVQAKFYLQASIHAFQFAHKIAKKPGISLRDKKKHFVYGAKLLELHGRHPNPVEMSSSDTEIFFNQWRGAEAYHYFMLAQEQLYNGKLHDSLCTIYRLQDYDDYISLTEIYSLYAFIACLNRAFGLCSRAFIKLKKGDHTMSTAECNEYNKLSWEIFLKNEANDLRVQKVQCFKCKNLIPYWSTSCSNCQEKFPTCMASGKPLIEGQNTWECPECFHKASTHLMNFIKNCPLCHTSIE
ncbi:WD repeat-containing protein 35 isoform X2 [Harmonia axyridis]|uniref:WD repeat-containing protein 35 isoform X2 n=1 Tax=Harmonia axyridis TaxID=115357 RepID=UPI001E276910|nr:WD repeat-containing protein 35 isoform X2 [Harmonia axyridis]